jgi:lipoprotein-anchoring transpeptidase ErfK/SrfK
VLHFGTPLLAAFGVKGAPRLLSRRPGAGAVKENAMRSLLAVAAIVGSVTALAAQPAAAHDMVAFSGYSPGTIVVRTAERRLYYVLSDGRAIRYPVGVGRRGMQWAGTSQINGKYIKPAWSAPDDIRRDYRSMPSVIPSGSPHNPMGAAAMTLAGGDYAIHGTNAPGTIGGFVSHGCIRMYNADVMDLYSRVGVGTSVVVTR